VLVVALPAEQGSTMRDLIDARNRMLAQVDADALHDGRRLGASGMAIAAEFPLEGFSRKMRARMQAVFRRCLVADLALEGLVV
jgi:hypothetical protein